ncbi:MAG: hypothetical protein N2689_13195 [Verrucomicrobiae bacterium]|nr:hypothetical protein [Verrucomicrobiae bacterium]
MICSAVFAGAAERDPAWTRAHLKPAMTADETRAFMKRLAQFVFDNHMKRDAKSPQRGMIYEYFWVERKGRADQFIQGEALDTMHDGAWFAAALVNAYRATGDRFYKETLTQWVLPFYLRMLNHSDTLFSARRDDAAPGAHKFNKEHALQEGEKGFVPYWWDDGGSVSLERRGKNQALSPIQCTDLLAGKPNPEFLLSGYSHGSSNHMAQDLAVMLQQAWLMLRNSAEPSDKKLAAEVAEAAKNLHECRLRHFNHIPMCCAAFGLTNGDPAELKRVPQPTWLPENHYWRALYDFKPGERRALPGFADDQQYRYYFGIAKAGGSLPRTLGFKTIYDAFTEPMLYRYYSDDADAPPGINRFDLHVMNVRDGRLEDYRSDRKGPFKGPRPIGSRMGPQNMVCCGWALQTLRAQPGLWEERCKAQCRQDARVFIEESAGGAAGGAPASATSLALDGVTLRLVSRRDALVLEGKFEGAQVVLRIFSRPDAQGGHAVVTLRKDRTVTAVNDRAEPLRILPHGDFGWALPYTVAKQQTAGWANGVELGCYSIQVGGETRNFCLASSEAAVKARLERELAGGLRTWEAIFDQYGYIPTGIGCHSILPGVVWDKFSDAGGYAHLLSAAAQWLMYLEKKSDWELQGVPSR